MCWDIWKESRRIPAGCKVKDFDVSIAACFAACGKNFADDKSIYKTAGNICQIENKGSRSIDGYWEPRALRKFRGFYNPAVRDRGFHGDLFPVDYFDFLIRREISVLADGIA